ncbi:MAG: two-component system, LytTR family, response regulator LytT [Thermoanaerobaculia bacterium]|nr:two-component system, LytTR family, response regulator LytT [Thermoanaerobaculia bacterium]
MAGGGGLSSEPLRAIVIDDEPLARESIRSLLEGDAEVRVVGEGTGADGAALIARTRPDLMFLDIQMPEVDGFALLEQVGAATVPAVIFVTAYDRYALKAFEVHALDYLLKPFDDRRFASALAHAKERARGRLRGEADNRIADLLQARNETPRSRFLIPVRDKTIVVDAADIDWIEASDYYVTLHAGASAHLLRQTMDEIETQLDAGTFFRVHRSTIVNIDRVREIHPLFRGDCALVLTDGRRLKLSRSRRKDFEARFARPKR